jgi:Protein of unknown function (DUF2911)
MALTFRQFSRMKNIIVSLTVLLFISASACSQASLPPLDKSPMDMSYYPTNYPVLKIQDKIPEPVVARVIYSRPRKEGRPIFGGLVEYGKLWRLGANEATEIEFYKNVTIGDKKISKGRYTLYAIVNEKTWTLILNKDTDTWGSFKYDSTKDIVRVEVPVQQATTAAESLTMSFEKSATGCNLAIFWETIKVALPINF